MDGIPKIEDTNCTLIFSIATTTEGYRATAQIDNGEVVMRRTAEWSGDAKLSEVANHSMGLAVGCYLEAQSALERM